MSNNTERIINHQDGLDLIAEIRGVKNAILGTAANGESDWNMAKVIANIRNGAGPVNLPIGTEMEFSAVAHISTSVGTTLHGETAGVTGCSVTEETFLAVEGVHRGFHVRFYYDGSHWRLETENGEIVSLSDYGVSASGSPKEGDYIDVSETASEWVFQVAHYDKYVPKNPAIKHHAVLMAKNCLVNSFQFGNSPMLAMACAKAAMPAGKYKFSTYNAYDGSATDGNKTYVFTTTSEIPANGGWTHSKIGQNPSWGGGAATDITVGTITTYGADHKTTIETGIAVTEYDAENDTDAVNLGDFCSEYVSGKTFENTYGFLNFTRRIRYGNGDYGTSLVRTYINGEGAANGWYSMKSIFDLVPSVASSSPGLLHNIDSDLKGAMVKVKVKYYLQDSDYSLMTALSKSAPIHWLSGIGLSLEGRVVTCEDYVFLPSIMEVGLGSNYNDNSAGNTVFDLYNGSTNADRIKLGGGSAKYWWLRSPLPWPCHGAALVEPAGTLSTLGAYDSCALVPACAIG